MQNTFMHFISIVTKSSTLVYGHIFFIKTNIDVYTMGIPFPKFVICSNVKQINV